ncbi:MAG: hypothetical protein QY322_02590 [bacterium]|nr:MAG: hypothetical protein QY322_02590 [bacterium]
MLKNKILGILNILLSLCFAYFIFSGIKNDGFPEIFSSEIFIFILFVFSLSINIFVVYKMLFKNNDKLSFPLYLVLTLSTIFWFILLFVTYFFASNFLFHLIILTAISIFSYFLYKLSKKIALMFLTTTVFILFISTIIGFNNDYCWRKGRQADKTGDKMMVATKEDAELLKNFGVVKEGNKIGVSFRTEMLCYQTFNFKDAISDLFPILK